MRICICRRSVALAVEVRKAVHECGAHRVVGCFGARDADVEVLRVVGADAFVLDCVMPRMDGIQLAEALAPAPCVLITPGGAVRAPENVLCIKRLEQLGDALERIAQRELPRDQRSAIERELLELGFRPQTRGFAQMRHALERVLADEAVLDDLKRHVYGPVGEACSCSAACVERNLRYAIECAWVRGDLAALQSRFGYTIDKERGKPTNRAFLAQISEHIRLSGA